MLITALSPQTSAKVSRPITFGANGLTPYLPRLDRLNPRSLIITGILAAGFGYFSQDRKTTVINPQSSPATVHVHLGKAAPFPDGQKTALPKRPFLSRKITLPSVRLGKPAPFPEKFTVPVFPEVQLGKSAPFPEEFTRQKAKASEQYRTIQFRQPARRVFNDKSPSSFIPAGPIKAPITTPLFDRFVPIQPNPWPSLILPGQLVNPPDPKDEAAWRHIAGL